MRAGLSFSYPPISLLLRQPLSIKKSYAGAIHPFCMHRRQGGGGKLGAGGVASWGGGGGFESFAWIPISDYV
jgi:hypothetical protein